MKRGVVGLVSIASALAACSLLTDLGDLGEGGVDASDDSPPSSCGAGSTCVPVTPSGWSGPFWIYYGDPQNRPATCPSATPIVAISGNDHLLDASVPCSGKACLPHCSGTVDSFTCGSTKFVSASSVDAGCAKVSANGSWAARFNNITTKSCTWTSSLLDAATTTWQAAMIGCTADASAATCAAGEVCAPNAPLPFEGKPCIFKSGDNQCPGAPYSQLRSSTLSGSVTPMCSANNCTCSVGANPCSVTVDYLGPSPTCGPPNAQLDGGCFPGQDTEYVGYEYTPTGTCSLGDGSSDCTISGTVSPNDQFTVCCAP